MPTGFALRKNGTCSPPETPCSITTTPFNICCPQNTSCQPTHNTICCATPNCAASVLEKPACSNSTWDLYNGNGGYFCCGRGTTGFVGEGGEVGCAVPGYVFGEGERLLRVVEGGVGVSSSGADGTTAASSATTSTMATATTTSPSQLSSRSTSNTGAIVGGVVGGVVGLFLLAALILWLLKRPRSQHQEPTYPAESKVIPTLAEIDGMVQIHELQGD